MNEKQKKILYRIIAAALMVAVLHFLPVQGVLRLALYMVPYLLIGYDILSKAAYGIRNKQPFDENFLMAVATVGAIALGEYAEAVAVMLFYQIGELFQSYAVGKSRRSISELMDIRPDCAYIENADGVIEAVDPDEVEPGTLIVIRPGEKIPIDGIVREGESALDTRSLTGESVPRAVSVGDEVLSGCINQSGTLKVETTKEFGESTASRILELVENAGTLKSRPENFISRFARVYTPLVCGMAAVLGICVPLVSMLAGHDPAWRQWIYRALTFLVISCPCALVISIPLTFFAGIGGAGTEGILIKGSVFLEMLANVRTAVFDKTGTLTEGVFEVTEVVPAEGFSSEKLLELAAMAEAYSTHPVSLSLKKALGKQVDATHVDDVQEIAGHGVEANVDGIRVAAGNMKLMKLRGISCEKCLKPGTTVYVAADGVYAGYILISDRLKETAKEAVRELKDSGVELVMLTGDVQTAAESVAAELGIDRFYAELLPGDKTDKIEEIMAAQTGKAKTSFTGDGINDAPVIMRADVGIAMGALGSDAAIEAADVVLMDDDPLKISKAIRIARKCMRIVYENIWFAIGVKTLCLVLGALGIATMWTAIFADVGVMIIAVLNAIRALNAKRNLR